MKLLLPVGVLCLIGPCLLAPLPRRLVDMTHTLDENTVLIKHPKMNKFKRDVWQNGTEDFGFWVQVEEYSSTIHIGTHIDAPAHFSKGHKTIDEIPLSQLVGPAAVVDTTRRAELDVEDQIGIPDFAEWESRTGQSLNGTIVLFRTGWGKRWGNNTMFLGAEDDDPDVSQFKWPSLKPEACQWLVDNRNVLGIGVETINFDKPNDFTYPCHRILLGHGLFAVENVANMDQLPIFGAELHVLPTKIGRGSGAPVRMMATFPEVVFDHHVTGLDSNVDCHII